MVHIVDGKEVAETPEEKHTRIINTGIYAQELKTSEALRIAACLAIEYAPHTTAEAFASAARFAFEQISQTVAERVDRRRRAGIL
jgi:hypothetical protein